MKQHKTQILAALALAFVLGAMAPSAVFASDGTDGVAAQAEGAAVVITPTDLYNAITAAKSDAGYAKYAALAAALKDLPENDADATTSDLVAVRQAIAGINPEAQVGDMDAADLREYVDNMADYKTYSAMLAAIDEVQTYVGKDATITADLINSKVPNSKLADLYATIDAFNNRVTGSLADNMVKLYNRINDTNNTKFNGYRGSVALVKAVEDLEGLGANATTSEITAAMNTVKAQMTGVTGLDDLNKAELIAKAKETTDFAKNQALYDALGFARTLTDNGTKALTAEAIVSVMSTETAQATAYSKLAAAAQAIDADIMKGLMTMPNTSANEDEKPTTPDSGIIGLIESGALDMGTVTLIASVAVASMAGLALIAKLYLKHKF